MTRPVPPGHAGEVTMVLAFLDTYRETMVIKIEGLTEEQARFKPTEQGNSLLNLIVHLAGVERRWAIEMIAGRSHSRDREAEFGELGISVDAAIADYREAYQGTNELVHEIGSVDEPCKGEAGYSVRWVLLHLLEETARHAGHADITRELIDGTTGF